MSLKQNPDDRVLILHTLGGSSLFALVSYSSCLDIICTSDDNADITPIVKSSHGIYIIINVGQNNFEQARFYPMPGSNKL